MRLLRTQDAKNPNPVLFSGKSVWTSSTQLADKLLCSHCEQLFHRNGEDWVLRHCYRGKGRFRLQEMIAGVRPVRFPISQAKLIPTRLVLGVEVDQLAYFAASVIWRAGVHKWMIDEHELKSIDIRDDQLEQLRLFLLQQTGFPTDTYLWISVSDAVISPVSLTMFPPYGGFHDGHYSFRFIVPGIMFALFMGCFVPPIVPRLCSVRSNDRLLHLTSNIEDEIFQYAVKFMKTASRSQSVRSIE